MRIALVSVDTRGGIQPYIALGLGLRRAGHEVRVVAPSDFAPLLGARGLQHHPLTGNVEELLRASGGIAEKGTLASMRYAHRETPRRVVQWAREVLQACEGVDLITGGVGGMVAGLAAAERLGVPFLETHLQPVGAPTSAFPGVMFPGMPRWLGAAGRRFSHSLSELEVWMPFRGAMQKSREALGLRGPEAQRSVTLPVLYGFSRHVLPEAPEWQGRRFVTGYWMLPAEDGWSPPPGLEAFLQRPGPVVCIGFGSMTAEDPKATAALVLDAVRRAGVRAVVLSGWGGLQIAANDEVFEAGSVPHDWLYPRMGAVV
ncbi:MAG: glycosyltransferase, partial [Myxococcaceae bacterium]